MASDDWNATMADFRMLVPDPDEQLIQKYKDQIEAFASRDDITDEQLDAFVEQKQKEYLEESFEAFARRAAAAVYDHSSDKGDRKRFIDDYVKVAMAHYSAPEGNRDKATGDALREVWAQCRQERAKKKPQDKVVDGSSSFPRFELDEAQLVSLTAIRIAAGDWAGIGASEEEAQDFLVRFIASFKSHGREPIQKIVWMMQNTLMAQRANDFFAIQKHAAFFPYGLDCLVILDEGWELAGKEGFLDMWRAIFSPEMIAKIPQHEIIQLTAGPGDSPGTAFTVHAPHAETRICAQYWYIYYTYGRMDKDWTLGMQYLTIPDELGREFDVMNVTPRGGVERKVFFVRHPQAGDEKPQEDPEQQINDRYIADVDGIAQPSNELAAEEQARREQPFTEQTRPTMTNEIHTSLPVSREYLELALEDGVTVEDITLRHRHVADLILSTGQLAACDPFTSYEFAPFMVGVPRGTFPVLLSVAEMDSGDQRVAFATVRFKETPPSTWKMMTVETDPATLEPGHFVGYGVDSGTGCFIDAAAGRVFAQRMNEEENFCDTMLTEMDKTYRSTWSWLDMKFGDGNLIAFSSGYGDGIYGTYAGLDSKGEMVVVVTDFMIVDSDEME